MSQQATTSETSVRPTAPRVGPDTYRRHPRSKAFVARRAEIIRLILKEIKAGDNANTLSLRMGVRMSKNDLYHLREGDTFGISDSRLWVLAEALGLRLSITIASPTKPNPAFG